MAKQRTVDLIFPVGGLNRRFAYQHQPPFTTPDCLNVWPDSPVEGRARGGSRPGLQKTHGLTGTGGPLGDGSPVRLLGQVRKAPTDNYTVWKDPFTFEGDEPWMLSDVWSPATALDEDMPTIAEEHYAYVNEFSNRGAIHEGLDIDTDLAYTIGIEILPHSDGLFYGGCQIYGGMAQVNPNHWNQGFAATIRCYLVEAPSTYHYKAGFAEYLNGHIVAGHNWYWESEDIVPHMGWFKVVVNQRDVKVYWEDELIINGIVDVWAGRWGFGLRGGGQTTRITTFSIDYYRDAPGVAGDPRMILCAGAGALTRAEAHSNSPYNVHSSFYVENVDGSMEEISTECDYTAIPRVYTIQADRLLQGAARLDKFYIADYSPIRISGTDGEIVGVGGHFLGRVGVPVFWWGNPEYGIIEGRDVVMISHCQGGAAEDGVYKVRLAGSPYLSFSPSADGSASDTTRCSYRIEAGPKVYDLTTGELSMWEADTGKGMLPVGCRLICLWDDRMVLAGSSTNPHQWYMSAMGDPLDWKYGTGEKDASQAGEATHVGEIGDSITALVPYTDDYLIVGCRASLWVLVGNPNAGGVINNISRTIGIVSAGAWCMGPDSKMYFLSRDGLYMLDPDGSKYPVALSRNQLPRALLNIDVNQDTVLLAYDRAHRGIHIYITPNLGGNRVHYWFNPETRTFWPMEFASNSQPTAILSYDADMEEHARVLLGGRDGYIRKPVALVSADDATAFNNYAYIGPIKLGNTTLNDGMLLELVGTLGSTSGNVSWQIGAGPSPEEAYHADAFPVSGMWEKAGRNHTVRPRARGQCFYLKVFGRGAPWSMEGAAARIADIGEQRLP